MKINEIDCWDGYKKKGTKPGTGKNKGKRVNNCVKEDGVIVPGVNTTVDVKPGQTEIEAAKFFGKGKPAELHKKARKNSTPHNLYNLGLTESQSKLMEAVIKQSSVMKVLYNISARKDNASFPVKFYNDIVINVSPLEAKKVIMLYLDSDEDKQKDIEEYIHTVNGFKELLQRIK